MRNDEELTHNNVTDVYDEIQNWQIFHVEPSYKLLNDENLDEERIQGEFIISNPWDDEFRLYITRDELRRLGRQLIEMADNDEADDPLRQSKADSSERCV